eukprot:60225_1
MDEAPDLVSELLESVKKDEDILENKDWIDLTALLPQMNGAVQILQQLQTAHKSTEILVRLVPELTKLKKNYYSNKIVIENIPKKMEIWQQKQQKKMDAKETQYNVKKGEYLQMAKQAEEREKKAEERAKKAEKRARKAEEVNRALEKELSDQINDLEAENKLLLFQNNKLIVAWEDKQKQERKQIENAKKQILKSEEDIKKIEKLTNENRAGGQ